MVTFDGHLNTGQRVMSGNWHDSNGASGSVTLNRGGSRADTASGDQPAAPDNLGTSQPVGFLATLAGVQQFLLGLFAR
jgi:hypothetical protein